LPEVGDGRGEPNTAVAGLRRIRIGPAAKSSVTNLFPDRERPRPELVVDLAALSPGSLRRNEIQGGS